MSVLDDGGHRLFDRTLPMSEVLADRDQLRADYPTRNSAGQEDSRAVPDATSVRSVVQDLLGLPLAQVDQVSLTRINADRSGDTVLAAGDLGAPGTPGFPFEGGHQPVFTSYTSDQLAFIRPLRAGIGDDVNYTRDAFQTDGGGAMVMTVRTHGAFLQPKLTASKTTVTKNKPTTLTVSYPKGDKPTGAVTYAWDFSDGSPGPADPGADTTPHQWTTNGSYLVTVTVKKADDAGEVQAGGVAQVRVKVGKTTSTGGSGGNGSGSGLTNGSSGGRGTYAGGNPTSPGGTGDTGTTTDPGQAGQQTTGGVTDSGITVQGVLLDATGAKQVTVRSTPSAPVAAAPTGAAKPLSRDLRWMLFLAPLLLLLGGVTRQSRWLAPRLPEPPWR